MDVKNSPYAEFLEGFIKSVMEHKPVKIGVCAILPEGGTITAYYGDCWPLDKAAMGFQLQSDAQMDITLANADMIIEAAEELANEDEDELS